jgi:hypothetical protein
MKREIVKEEYMGESSAKVIGMDEYIPKSRSRFNKVNSKRNKNRTFKKNPNREKLEEVTRILDEYGVYYEMKSKFHVKIGDVNYFPGKGIIYIDNDFGKLEETGIEALKQVLREYEVI